MNEIILRLKMKSPKFFVRIQLLCGAVAAAALYLKANDTDLMLGNLSLASVGVGFGAVGIFIGQLTVADKPALDAALHQDPPKPFAEPS